MIAQIPYIKASELVRTNANIYNGNKPAMTAIDANTVNITSLANLYARDFNNRVWEPERFIQLLPNHKYTLIVKTSGTFKNYNYIITYEALLAAKGTSSNPSGYIRFQSGGNTYTRQFTTGASGKMFIYIGGQVGQITVQIK